MAKATTTRGPGTMVRDADAPVLADDIDLDAEDENGAYVYVGRFDSCVVRLTAIGNDATSIFTINIEGAEDSAGTNGRVLGAFVVRAADETTDFDFVLRLSSVWLPYMRWSSADYTSGGFTAGDLALITVHTEYDHFSATEQAGFEDATGSGAA